MIERLQLRLLVIRSHRQAYGHGRNVNHVEKQAEDGEDLDEMLFRPDGHWREAPQEWGDPEQTLRQLDFMRVLDACVEKLPGQQGRLFMMREWLELDTEEICKVLAISPTNLWVMLHRARLRLRECLQLNWFSAA